MEDMTQTTGPTTGSTNDTNGSGLDRFFGWLRSIDLRRDGDDKWLAGVCSGIATRLGVDPIVIRAVLVLLVVMGGLGITVYLIAWAFVPNDKEDIVAERALRDGDVLAIILLVVIGLSLLGGTGFVGDVPGMGWIWWVVLPVAVVVWLVVRKRNPRPVVHATAGQGTAAQGTAGQGTAAQGTAGQGTAAAGSAQGVTWSAPTAPYGSAAPYGSPSPYGSQAPYGSTGPYGSATPPGGALPPGPPSAQQPRPPQPQPPRPPRAPRVPRRRSGGLGATLLVSGLAVAAYGLVSWAHRAGDWAGSEQTVALGAALGVIGLGVLVLGLAGRRAGLTGFIAVVLALVTWAASVVPDIAFGGGIGERVWRPSATDTTASYRLGLGSADLDLSRLPDDPGTARQVTARVGVGELRIRIPQGLTVEVRSSVNAGDITRTDFGSFDPLPPSPGSDPLVYADTNDNGRNISTVHTFGEGTPDVVIDAHVGLGQILIGKE